MRGARRRRAEPPDRRPPTDMRPGRGAGNGSRSIVAHGSGAPSGAHGALGGDPVVTLALLASPTGYIPMSLRDIMRPTVCIPDVPPGHHASGGLHSRCPSGTLCTPRGGTALPLSTQGEEPHYHRYRSSYSIPLRLRKSKYSS